MARVGLVAPMGLWMDDHPIADIYSMLPYDFPGYLFHDPATASSVLTGGIDFEDPTALSAFLITNSRRLGTAGKVLFPIPNRRLAKRLYRVTNPVAIVWGASDRLIPPVYADRGGELLPQAVGHDGRRGRAHGAVRAAGGRRRRARRRVRLTDVSAAASRS